MRLVFMGTPDFAEASLRRLIADGHEIAAVYTQPDRARGRGHAVSFSPVKELAVQAGVPVLQPESLRSEEELQRVEALRADLIVVVAYGKLLPERFLQAAKHGAINLHGSLLPKYRGAAPIQWAVLNGETRTGVTTFFLNAGMDAGEIIDTAETKIGEFETSGELFDRLKDIGAELLSGTVRKIEAGTETRTPQNDAEATYCQRLGKELCPIDWTKPPRAVIKQICGLQPWPVATMELAGETVKVYSAGYTEGRTDRTPGTLLQADENGLEVACGDGETVCITEIQLPGKRRMAVSDYLRGHPLKL